MGHGLWPYIDVPIWRRQILGALWNLDISVVPMHQAGQGRDSDPRILFWDHQLANLYDQQLHQPGSQYESKCTIEMLTTIRKSVDDSNLDPKRANGNPNNLDSWGFKNAWGKVMCQRTSRISRESNDTRSFTKRLSLLSLTWKPLDNIREVRIQCTKTCLEPAESIMGQMGFGTEPHISWECSSNRSFGCQPRWVKDANAEAMVRPRVPGFAIPYD